MLMLMFLILLKKINVKSFEYKNEKFGVGKQIGFLANQLLDELPEVFSKNIIGKDREDNLNMNYIKINVCCGKHFKKKSIEENRLKVNYLR